MLKFPLCTLCLILCFCLNGTDYGLSFLNQLILIENGLDIFLIRLTKVTWYPRIVQQDKQIYQSHINRKTIKTEKQKRLTLWGFLNSTFNIKQISFSESKISVLYFVSQWMSSMYFSIKHLKGLQNYFTVLWTWWQAWLSMSKSCGLSLVTIFQALLFSPM